VANIADLVIIGGGIVGVSIAHCLGLKKPKGLRVAGITLGPAAGQLMADFIVNGAPSPYLESLSLRRFIGKRASP
jgi:glycine/D-amino acid oxidase-like deaminating enzyme